MEWGSSTPHDTNDQEYLQVEEKGGYHESSACHSCFAMDYHHILKVPFQPQIGTLAKCSHKL